MKRENKKIDKKNLVEVTGKREQLKDYLGEEFKVEAFVTNSIGYVGRKRLITEIKIKTPIETFFINHVWFDVKDVGNLKHGYQVLSVKVIEYKDQINNESKYALKYIGLNGKKYIDNTMIKPKWKKDE